jgi:hypothetical protein
MIRTSRGLFLLGVFSVSGLVLGLYAPLLLANDSILEVSVLPRPATGLSEYVEVSLSGENDVDLSGWYIMDERSSPSVVFTFPASTELASQTPLRVCQGALGATPEPPCQYHAGGTAKWNNDGDTLRLFDSEGSEKLILSYTDEIEVGEVVGASVSLSSEGSDDGDTLPSDEEEDTDEVVDEAEEEQDTEEEGAAEEESESDGGVDDEGAHTGDEEEGSEDAEDETAPESDDDTTTESGSETVL